MSVADQEHRIRHARIELPPKEFERLKRQADRFMLGVSAYVRQAVMKQIEADEENQK